MSDYDYESELHDLKVTCLDDIEYDLEAISGSNELDFHATISQAVDQAVPYDITECATIIDESGNLEYVDEGLISMDRGLLDGVLRPMAYECLSQELFEDDFFQYLQHKLNNENVTELQAKIIISHMDQYRKDELQESIEPEYLCEECGTTINFGSESETYDYSENDYNVTTYTCEDCLTELRKEIG